MILVLKVTLTVTIVILAMLLGFAIILKLDISPNMTSFLTLTWMAMVWYSPKWIFKEKDIDKK